MVKPADILYAEMVRKYE
jgi:hypothetical protein